MAFVSTAPLPARRAPHLRPQRPARPRTELQPSCCARNVSRRVFLAAGAAVSAGFALLPAPRQQRASASGLLLFPLREPLYNEYYFVRAGETLNLGPTGPKVARTNPVEKTSVRLHGLTRRGVAQSLANAAALQDSFGLGPGAWIWYSQNNAANETAHIIASSLHVRNEQIVPEFSFLDARGVGALEGQPVSFAETEIAKIDAQSVSARMAPGEDGTPNEVGVSSLSDFIDTSRPVPKPDTVLD